MPKIDGKNSSDKGNAVAPTIGEIEGRFLVLELVALSSMTRLLRLHDEQEKADLIAEIRHDIEIKGRDCGLHFRDIIDAQSYAEDLLRDAQAQADGLDDIKHAFLKSDRDE
ncbi:MULTISPECIES: hypothetical protein [Rhizobium]|jgi:hypothetical protein|uniref:hypothetical protein n=1 Tax=Rhizobium TaxID=379 RepID=UPI000DDC84BF|nr:hypothetical protein [Rhizobium lusitanum]NTJ09639.1 hypothetical protein [Rhizobium lusitanum]